MAPLSVLVVSFRTPTLTLAAVRSALRIEDVREVIVVDNDSRDQTTELLRAICTPRLQLIVNVTNTGFGTAANQAASSANGDVLILLNSDAELTAAAARELLRELRLHEGRAVVGARLIDPAGAVQRSAGLLSGPFDLTVRGLGLQRIAGVAIRLPGLGWALRRNRLSTEYESALLATTPIDTSMVSGACFAIGRDAFRELGGFDERYFMYFEDADLCKRAAAAGMPIRYVPSAVVTHIGGASSHGDYHFSPMHARSMRQYLEKWWGPPGVVLAILLLWVRLIGHAIVLHRGTARALAAVRAALR